MNKALPLALSTLVLLGCDGTLVFQYPKFVPSNRDLLGDSIIAEITPRQAKIGDSLTLQVTGLSSESVAQAYINPANRGGGDPEDSTQTNATPVFRLGRLVPVNGVATLSFELRSQLGNDQFGNPFTIASSQSWTILVSQRDKYGRLRGTSGGKADFTIL